MISTFERHDMADSAASVVAHVRALIDRGALGPGARLPPERDLARQVGVSRPTIRAGLRTLAALGVIRSRRGSGTYIPEGPPTLGSADAHRQIYQAIRARDVDRARRSMNDHLLRARSYQAKEQLLQGSAATPHVSTVKPRRATATQRRATQKAPRARRVAR